MAKQVFFVPKQYGITYKNQEGEDVKFTFQTNRVYQVDTKDGQSHIITVANIESERTPDGKRRIRAQVEFTPGYMNVMKASNLVLDIDDIVNIEIVDVLYERSKRVFKDPKSAPDTESFTFAFDTNKKPSQYRITVYAGEFLSFAAKYNGDNRTYYGHITSVDETTITILRYMSVNGVRSVRKKVHIKLEDLLGIYRYSLMVEPLQEVVVDEGNATDAAGIDEPKDEAPENA